MKKIVLALAVVVIVTALLASCEQAQQPDDGVIDVSEIVIAGIHKMGDLEWFQDQAAAAGRTIREEWGASHIYIDVAEDPDLFLQALDNVILQDVDGVLMTIPDQRLSRVAIEKLDDAGIPFLACDDKLEDEDGEQLAPWIGIDAYVIGEATAEWIIDYMEQNNLTDDPEVGFMLLSANHISSCVPRTQAQYDVIARRLPDFPQDRVWEGDHTGDSETGFNAASAIITGNPHITKWMVLGIHDDGVVGAVRALEQMGLDRAAAAVGLGGSLAPAEFAMEYSAFKAAAYFSAEQVGGTSANFIMNHIVNGEDIPWQYAVSAMMVTRDNYRELMTEYLR